jgi:hypothetical protein
MRRARVAALVLAGLGAAYVLNARLSWADPWLRLVLDIAAQAPR